MRIESARFAGIVVSVVVFFGLAANALAAPQGPWVLPASDLSAPFEDAADPRLAASPDGTITAVWNRYDGSNTIVQAATRPAGANYFGAPVDLSAPGQNTFAPQIVASPDGTVTATWTRYNGSNYIVQAATRPAGASTFGTPVNLSASGHGASAQQVAASPDGTVTATWYRNNGSNTIVQAATRPAGANFFAAPVDLSAPGRNAFDPQLAVSPDGTITAVWYRYDGSNYIVQAATRPAGASTFGAPVDLSAPGKDGYDPQVAAAADGTVTAVWRRFNGSNYIVQAATRPAGANNFKAPVNLSAPGQTAYDQQVAASPDGTVAATWTRSNGSNFIVQAATRPAGASTFGAPVDLSASGQNASDPQLAASPDGTITATWTRSNGSNWIIQAATRPEGASTFGTPVDLSAPGQNANGPRITASPDGTVTATWRRYNGSNDIIQAASTVRPLPLEVTKTGNGSGKVTSNPEGIDCGSDCDEAYLPGTKVTLTATADPGSTFTGWSGGCQGQNAVCQVTVNEALTVTANFSKTPNPNPPNDDTALYNPATGKLKIRLKCGNRFRPKCLKLTARVMTGKGKKAKVMSKAATARNVKAGKWKIATLKIKPRYRQKVKRMANRKAKTLWVKIKVTYKKKGRKKTRTVFHHYRVISQA